MPSPEKCATRSGGTSPAIAGRGASTRGVRGRYPARKRAVRASTSCSELVVDHSPAMYPSASPTQPPAAMRGKTSARSTVMSASSPERLSPAAAHARAKPASARLVRNLPGCGTVAIPGHTSASMGFRWAGRLSRVNSDILCMLVVALLKTGCHGGGSDPGSSVSAYYVGRSSNESH